MGSAEANFLKNAVCSRREKERVAEAANESDICWRSWGDLEGSEISISRIIEGLLRRGKRKRLSDEIGQRVVTRRMGGVGDEALAERDLGVAANRIQRLSFRAARAVRFEQGYG